MVRDQEGRVRPLAEEELTQIEYDEMVEEEAAEMERDDASREWRTFAATQYRSWEEWAVAAEEDGQPSKKARVQVLVQGLGGRIVRDVNWLVPLREGEQLSYSVSVQQGPDEDDGAHPEAASSGLDRTRPVVAHELESVEDDRDRNQSLLPVTGWNVAPVLGAERDRSLDRGQDFDVNEFVLSKIGVKFFGEWMKGRVTCRFIGERFGYSVLGKFYAVRDEMKHAVEEGIPLENAEEVARTRVTSEVGGTPSPGEAESAAECPADGHAWVRKELERVKGTVRDTEAAPGRPSDDPVPLNAEGSVAIAADPPELCEGHVSPEGEQLRAGHEHSEGVALVPEPGTVTAAEVIAQVVESTSEGDHVQNHQPPGREVSAESSGSRQSNLMHWLKFLWFDFWCRLEVGLECCRVCLRE